MIFPNQTELFLHLWNTRERVSEISGLELPDKKHYKHWWLYAHCIGKGAYPRFKLREDNIIFMLPDEHDLWDNHKSKIVDKPEWKWVFDKESKLKIEYHQGKNK